jgi:two-component system LytT family response regulator
MSKIKTLIVDDEHHCRHNLAELISEYCPALEVVAMASSVDEALHCVEEHKPKVLFLDIRMPGRDGFDMLAEISTKDIAVVFTTAHNEYAIRALKEGAVDYLEKPISIEELEDCVTRIEKRNSSGELFDSKMLQNLLRESNLKDMDKTTIPTADGFVIVNSSDIIRLEANESYTRIYLSNGDKHLSSKNIRVFEQNLNPRIFFRTHKSHIVNVLYHLTGFSRIDGNVALMSNGYRVPISRRKLTDFLQRASA